MTPLDRAGSADGAIWMIGCGAMGGAMLRRWIECGTRPDAVTVITRGDAELPTGVRHCHALPAGPAPETLVLAVKPQQLDAVAAMVGGVEPGLLVSILAGVDGATLARRIPAAAIVRAMPNLPVAIGRGVVALHTTGTDPAIRDRAERLAVPLGLVEWIADETHFDGVTALAGSGPGFVFRFIDALAHAGAALGIPRDQAARLAIATIEGSAIMAAAATDTPAMLADRVASPGGSTRKGLDILDDGDALATLLIRTLAASARRNADMAAEARQPPLPTPPPGATRTWRRKRASPRFRLRPDGRSRKSVRRCSAGNYPRNPSTASRASSGIMPSSTAQ